MARPSPLVLLVALSATLFFIAAQPFLRVFALLAIGAMLLGAVVRALARRGWWHVLWGGAVVLALGAFLALVIVRPQPRITYIGDIVSHAPGIVESRGFYPTQTDASGLRYAWTQDRATVVMNFLVHKPVTLSVVMRSAAVSGGPDAPIHVVVNDVEVGQLYADPHSTAFQPQALRFIPPDWGGEQTEIKFIATPFQPGKGDNRTLGVAVQSLTVDTTEAWSGVTRRRWLLWALPALGALAGTLTLAARRGRPASPLLGYGAVAAAALGALCAATLVVLVLRIGVIAPLVYRVWLLGGATLALCFAIAALALPFGAPYAPGLGWRAAARVTDSRAGARVRRWRARLPVTHPAAPATGAEMRRAVRRDLIVLFVFALAVRVIWLLVSPPWIGPDEPDHYIYASHIAEEAEIPHPPSPKYPAYPEEQLHSQGISLAGDLSTGLSGSAQRIAPYYPFGYDYQMARDYSGPAALRYSEAGGRATGYPPLYFMLAALPYKALQWAPVLSRLYAVRFTSALLGALGCVFAYLFAFEIRRERRWGWALGMAMALLPMYVFVTAIANNDAAMDCAATGLLWLTMRAWQRREPGNALVFAIGLAAGLLLFAKPNAPALLVVAAAVVLIKAFPLLHAAERRVRRFLLAIGAFVGGLAVGYGPWLVAHVYYYGDIGIAGITPLGPFHLLVSLVRRGGASPPTAAPATAAAATYSFAAYLRHEQIQGGPYFFWLLVKTVWGYFGWLDLPMDDPVYRAILIVCAIGLLGFALQCVLQPRRRSALLLVLAMVAAHVLFLFFVPDYLLNFRHNGGGYGLQGRYLLPVLAPFLFMLLSGWDHLLRERPVAVRLAPFFVLGVQGVALATIVTAYYGVVFG